MGLNYLHHHPEFSELIRIVAQEHSIEPFLIEKDYWIMHALYGLQKLGMTFYMKGGTSLSKGYKIIHRFSEDIDILIEPPPIMEVATGRNQDNLKHRESRATYYDWLAQNIKLEGMIEVVRAREFDDEKYRSGGIRLIYQTNFTGLKGLKEGILLEVGFDDIAPNQQLDISSWAYDFAADKVTIIDNRAKGVPCYDSGYTLVEKLQAIARKFRKQQERGVFNENFMRHYYDVYCLLQDPGVLKFIGTPEYYAHKKRRFSKIDLALSQALLLENEKLRTDYEKQYNFSTSLYYKGKPGFQEILNLIRKHLEKL